MCGNERNGREDRGHRVGVVDVGSNSVRLVVYEALTRSPAFFFNEKVLCGLGADLSRTGRLSAEGRRRALKALRRFAALAARMDLDVLDGVATAAVRDAEDGPEFCDLVAAQTGLRLRVASGADEARLAAQGVLLGWPGAKGIVADLGGASLELVHVGAGAVESDGATFPLGPLRLDGLSAAEADATIAQELESAAGLIGTGGGRLFLVGGAWRAMTKLHMARTGYDLDVLHGFTLSGEQMLTLAEEIAGADPTKLKGEVDVSSARLAVTPLGARVLAGLIRAVRPEKVSISAFGLREGVLWEHLPPEMRRQDPLLSASRAMEARLARFPGFGDELADWLAPLFEGGGIEERVRRAACLLSDCAWSAHPDHRDEACLDNVRRANLTGLGHRERVFVAAVLAQRYRSGRKLQKKVPGIDILAPDELQEAQRLGRAIRLGAMLSGSTPGTLPHAALRIEEGRLTLRLDAAVRDLAGEVLQRRLASVAEALGLDAALIET